MKLLNRTQQGMAVSALLLAGIAGPALAAHTVHDIEGITGPNFTLVAKAGYISTAEGNSVYFWGFANGAAGAPQYPGPTLIVNQGQAVTVTLSNALPVPVSIVFPGQAGVSATGGTQGLLTREVVAGGGVVTYSFTASQPGTYLYESGTRPDLQTEMGLVGALIVRPSTYDAAANRIAYNHADSLYEHEFLFLLTEMDEKIHILAEQGKLDQIDTAKRWPVYWFINGRTGTDTVLPAHASWLPNQPYDAMVMVHATDKVLLRVIGGGRDSHPFHVHGNHAKIIARDGRLLGSGPGSGADLAQFMFTIPSSPGGTYDGIFTWTGEKLGWDVYGHAHDIDANGDGDLADAGDIDHNGNGIIDVVPMAEGEYAGDHGKPFPVKLPGDQDLTFGQMYSGSPFLGQVGSLPPGEGGFNPVGGFMYMWHSHNEKELCNNNIFGGGMLTFFLVSAHPNP